MIKNVHRQRGVTLIVTLVMLVMLTLFGVSAIRLSNVNLRVVGNYQWQKEMEALADAAIEQVSSSHTNFSLTPVGEDICKDGRIVAIGACTLLNPRVGSVAAPRCQTSHVATGSSEDIEKTPFKDNHWIVTATVLDTWSGASVTITRGMSTQQLDQTCPE